MTEDKLSYADAIRKASRPAICTNSSRPDHSTIANDNTWRRADAIETPASASTCIDDTFVPRAVRRKWAISNKKPTSCDAETQTEDEPINETTQTGSDAETQTVEVTINQ